MKTEWDESITTGNRQLDDEHKRLIQILNRIEAHQNDPVESEAVSLVIEEIREFASYHFRHEEKYMQQINFPDFEDHKEQHKRFREKIASLCLDVMDHKKEAPKNIYQCLSDWVANHTCCADKKFCEYSEKPQPHMI